MRYNKIEFTSGLGGFAYQQINDNGEVEKYLTEDGKVIDFMKDGKEIVYEARFIEESAEVPFVVEEGQKESVDVVVEQPPEDLPGSVEELEEKIRQVVASM